jgi:hypothetical protein
MDELGRQYLRELQPLLILHRSCLAVWRRRAATDVPAARRKTVRARVGRARERATRAAASRRARCGTCGHAPRPCPDPTQPPCHPQCSIIPIWFGEVSIAPKKPNPAAKKHRQEVEYRLLEPVREMRRQASLRVEMPRDPIEPYGRVAVGVLACCIITLPGEKCSLPELKSREIRGGRRRSGKVVEPQA